MSYSFDQMYWHICQYFKTTVSLFTPNGNAHAWSEHKKENIPEEKMYILSSKASHIIPNLIESPAFLSLKELYFLSATVRRTC